MTEKTERPARQSREPGDARGPSRKTGAPKPDPSLKGLEARQAALDILTLVRGGQSLDEALENARSFDALKGADRGFARAIASVVLRRQGVLDHVLGAYLDRPMPKRGQRAMEILRITAAQSLFFDTPDHAAVSTGVALVKTYAETQGYAGLVNAIARKVARNGATVLADLPARIDTPAWLWRAWERQFGPAGARAIAAAHAKEAPLDLTPKNGLNAPSIARALGGDVVLGRTVRLASGVPVPALPGYEDGEWWVQDAAAALPASLFGDVAGKTVYDLCAAPGGKTMQLAAGGAAVTAVDISGHRLKRLQENLSRCGLAAETVKEDVLTWSPSRPADCVLLDAPCSATGTIRRHPDILRTKTADDVAALARTQSDFINKAWSMLKPGGLLVYAVCSLQAEEGERQIAAAMARFDDMARAPIAPAEIGGLEGAVTRHGDLLTRPAMIADKGGLDGFFAARLRKPG